MVLVLVTEMPLDHSTEHTHTDARAFHTLFKKPQPLNVQHPLAHPLANAIKTLTVTSTKSHAWVC